MTDRAMADEALRSAIADLPRVQQWFVVGTPWGNGDFVVSGHPDPHLGTYVCDTESFDGEQEHSLEYAAYIAAACPATVNRLLQDVEALKAKVRHEQARVAELEAALHRLAQVAVWDEDSDRDEFDAAMHQAETALIASSPDQSVDANKMGGGDCAGGGGEVDHG